MIDLRTLRPLDDADHRRLGAPTRRAVVVDEGWRSGGLAAEIAARIVEQAFYDLDAPWRASARAEVPIPYAQPSRGGGAAAAGDHRRAARASCWAADESSSACPRSAPTWTPGTLVEWLVAARRRGQARRRRGAWSRPHKGAIDVEIFDDGVVDQLLVEPGAARCRSARAWRCCAGPTTPRAAGAAGARTGAGRQRPRPRRCGRAGRAARGNRGATRAISPAARRRAAELGVDLDALTRHGPGGAVILADVEARLRSAAPPARRQAQPTAAARRPSTAPCARAIGRRHGPLQARDPALLPGAHDRRAAPPCAWLERLNADRPVAERLLPAVLLVKAVALRAARGTRAQRLLRRRRASGPAPAIHVGLAIALRGGGSSRRRCTTPTSARSDDADGGLRDLVARARAGSCAARSWPTRRSRSPASASAAPRRSTASSTRRRWRWSASAHRARPWVVEAPDRGAAGGDRHPAADHRVSDGHRGGLFSPRSTAACSTRRNL